MGLGGTREVLTLKDDYTLTTFPNITMVSNFSTQLKIFKNHKYVLLQLQH